MASEFNEEVENSGVYDNPAVILTAEEKRKLAIRTGQTRDARKPASHLAVQGLDPDKVRRYPLAR